MPLIETKAPASPGDATRVARLLHRLALAPDKADEYAKNGIAGERTASLGNEIAGARWSGAQW
jgi:hypothetical protein